jgi:hypothetical protein
MGFHSGWGKALDQLVIGFILEQEDIVRQTYAKLVVSDVHIVYPLGQLGGALTFQCYAPGSISIEVSWRP